CSLPRARILQWRGAEPDGRDHRSLRHYPFDRARQLLSALVASRFDGVLTLEGFDPEELASPEAMRAQAVGCRPGGAGAIRADAGAAWAGARPRATALRDEAGAVIELLGLEGSASVLAAALLIHLAFGARS